jgi:hypothetical protein
MAVPEEGSVPLRATSADLKRGKRSCCILTYVIQKKCEPFALWKMASSRLIKKEIK